jgi:hypothetical protein
MGRVALILLIALGLSPGLYWREPLPPPNRSPIVRAERIVPAGERIGGPQGPVVEGVWHLTSPNDLFNSFSALLAFEDGSLLSFSDQGKYLRLPHPPGGAAQMGDLFPRLGNDKPLEDVESATRDPESGRIWIGLEGRNAIIRMKGDLSGRKIVRPPEMHDWPYNRGPESLLRLSDGRFLVLSEGRIARGHKSVGLLFPSDPVDGAHPQSFTFLPPGNEMPSDIAQLPDGRVLILTRGVDYFGLPPHFTVHLLIADPADIRPGKDWPSRLVAKIGGNAVPYENYEGLAVSGGKDGGPVTLWLISDDNQSLLIQRTLLVKLRWQPPPKG